METIEALQTVFGPRSQSVIIAITNLGSESAYILLLALYYWLINPEVGRRIGMILSLSFCTNVLLKDLFVVPRPYVVNPDVATAAAQATAGGAAFPSGHAQGAATFWGSLALHYQRSWLWAVAIVIMLVVSLSRVILGVHYPLDVIGGLAIGLGLAWLGMRLPPMSWLVATRMRRIAIVLGCAVLAMLVPDLAKPLGVLAGFGVSQVAFSPPKSWGGRMLVGLLGVAASFGCLLGLEKLMIWLAAPGWVEFWRYWLVTMLVVVGWPRLFTRLFR